MMGDMLLSAAKANPQIDFQVFCGHVHESYEGKITSNLLLRAGSSEYANPYTQGVFEI
jgi:hypothetical protein